MKKYTKKSPEYISNGYYKIGKSEFMNIWTFKNHYKIETNKTLINSYEGKNFVHSGIAFINTVPDKGMNNNILAYPVVALKHYYFKN